MQKLQRKAGLFLPRSADDAQVGLLLKDFEEGDKMLKVIIEATKQFRVAWTELLQRASGMATDFEAIYQFIPGEPENNARYRPTTRDQLAKVRAFKEAMAQVRDVIIQELGDVERRVTGPAKEARKAIENFRKIIKIREDRKLDYERYKSRTDAIERKSTRSERDANALMKHQVDLESSEKGYEVADEQLKRCLPGLTQGIYDLLPRLVHAQCMVQNTMLGHYYTALHDYSQEYGYPIPSPEWRQVQSEFEDQHPRIRKKTESIGSIQSGKAVKQPFESRPDSLQTKTVSHKGFAPMRSNGSLPPPVPMGNNGTPPSLDLSSKPTRTVSNQSYTRPSPPASTASFRTTSDYFIKPTGPGAGRQPSLTPKSPNFPYGSGTNGSHSAVSLASSAAAAVAGKKKPPPPPPKRKPSGLQQDYVVALYDFPGDGDGDLQFREGDKIRVIKKTDSTNDWWDGECRGMKGSFPANYCKAI